MSKNHWKFEALTPSHKLKLFRRGDPRVPADWTPPNGVRITFPGTTISWKSWDELAERRKCTLFEQGSPRVPEGWTPPVRTKGPKSQVLIWDQISDRRKSYLFRTNDPRVPKGWTPPYKGGRAQKANFFDLSPRIQRRLWSSGSPRVPEGWSPPVPVQRTRAQKINIGILKPWNELSHSSHIRLALQNDPRVPEGWTHSKNKRGRPRTNFVPPVPAQKVPKVPKLTISKRTWEDLAEPTRIKLYKQKSARVPQGWKPKNWHPKKSIKPLELRRKSSWNSLTYAEQVQKFWALDPIVPAGWQPPVERNRSRPGVPGVPKVQESRITLNTKVLPTPMASKNWGKIPYELQDLHGIEFHVALTKYLERHPEVLNLRADQLSEYSVFIHSGENSNGRN